MPIHSSLKTHMSGQQALNCDDLHEACVIDHHGKEIPITQEMISESCEKLSQKTPLNSKENDLSH